MKIIKFLLVFAVLLGVGLLIYIGTTKVLQKNKERATWIWHTKQIVEEQEELLTFLQEKKVSTVFLQINRNIPNKTYEQFIQHATKLSIDVQALNGSPSWVSSKGTAKQEKFFSWLETYQNEVSDDAKFRAVHLDIEPYLLEDWKVDYAATVRHYQEIIKTSKERSAQLHLPLEVDIPFWFDKRTYSNDIGTGILSEWVIDQTDGITIMAYRDKAEGNNGIIELSRSEIEYAATVNKKVSIGIETTKSSEGDHLSFFNMNETKMNEQLSIVEKEFSTAASFNRISIHSIDGWRELPAK